MFEGKVIKSIKSADDQSTEIRFTDGSNLLIETVFLSTRNYETSYSSLDKDSGRWFEIHKDNL